MTSSGDNAVPYEGTWTKRARELDQWTAQHKVVVSATTASLVSTFTGFPLDSLKSRLQSSRESTSLPRLAAEVIREEGVGGLWRGFPLPLITISIVRTISFTIYTSSKRILNSDPAAARALAAGNSDVEGGAKGKGKAKGDPNWINLGLGMFSENSARDVALTSLLAGGASGAVVCVGSAPFELVKLEYQIFRDSHPEHFPRAPAGTSVHAFPNTSLPQHPAGTSASIPSSSHGHEAYEHERRPVRPLPRPSPSTKPLPPKGDAPTFKPPTTLQAVKLIVDKAGWGGLYTGWRLHFIRDTLGTALYFAEYDVMRYYLGRKSTDKRDGQRRGLEEQGELPQWAKGWLPKGLVPFMCGSVAGVTSWALIYPVDAIKTKAQQRALSGLAPRTPLTQLRRLVRGIDPDNPKPWLTGIARLYRGLGVSMIRSMLTHGLLWTIVDWANGYIDTKPFERLSTHLV